MNTPLLAPLQGDAPHAVPAALELPPTSPTPQGAEPRDWDVVAHFRPHRKWLIKLGFGPMSNHVLYQMLLHRSAGYEPESQHGVQTPQVHCGGAPVCNTRAGVLPCPAGLRRVNSPS